MGDDEDAAWRKALISLSEGACPVHGGSLRADGWCPRCEATWSLTAGPRVGFTQPEGER